MSKYPVEFIKIDEVYKNAYNMTVEDIPDRVNTKQYKSFMRNILSEYLDKNIRITKKELILILKGFSRRRDRMINILNSYILDYNDIKNEYLKIIDTIDSLDEQRMKYRLGGLNDISLVHNVISIEKNDTTFYRYKINHNYGVIRDVIKTKFINARREVRAQEFYIKILKFLIREVNYMISKFFV